MNGDERNGTSSGSPWSILNQADVTDTINDLQFTKLKQQERYLSSIQFNFLYYDYFLYYA